MLRVQSPMIPIVGEMARRRPGTISLGQGVVHYPPPESVSAAAARATQDPRAHRYSLSFGIDELLAAVRNKLQVENGITISGDRKVAITAGSNMSFVNAILAVADSDDEVIILSPFYFNHEMAIDIAGCRAVVVPTDENYQPDVAAIEAAISSRTRAVVTISPNNPTGTVYRPNALRAINDLCRRRGIYHITDEAYEYFTYGGAEHFSPASIPGSEGHTIALYSLSKAYGMAGWRLGYMLIPAHLEEAVKKIQDTNLICPPVLNQLAAVAALGEGRAWCRSRIEPLVNVRGMVLTALKELGDRVRVPEPHGAFYALLRVNTDRRDMELVELLINDFGVAVMPGSTFGISSGCYLRIAYGALAADTVAEGIGRLVRGLRSSV
jgi:aspartate/methionine/tyrosine aminotransferase